MAILTLSMHADIQREFDQILTLSEVEKKMISTNEPYSYENYVTFALIASGVSADRIPHHKKIVDQLIKNLAEEIKTKGISDDKAKRAEFILDRLHKTFLRRYFANQTRIDETLENRMFNCVSSAVLYSAICRKFGILITGVIVPDHVFAQLKLPDQKIDIETTLRYGFDPSKGKEVLDQFGRLTGFVYVNQKNYKKRSEISDRQMIALILSNRYKHLSDRKRNLEATSVLYKAFCLADDLPWNLNTWGNGLENYIISLEQSKRFADALYVIDQAEKKFPKLKEPQDLRHKVYLNWSYDRLRSKDFDRGIEIAEEGLKFFVRDQKLLQNLKSGYINHAQTLTKRGDFDGARSVLDQAEKKFPNAKEIEQTIVSLIAEETKSKTITEAEKIYDLALQKYPRNRDLLELYAFIYIESAQLSARQHKFQEAINTLDQGEKRRNESLFRDKIYRSKSVIFNNWGLDLAKNRNYATAKSVIERGLEIDRNSNALQNNWDTVILEWSQDKFRDGQFSAAIDLLTNGLRKTKRYRQKYTQFIEAFHNDTAVDLLKKGKIQKGIDCLEAGLKLVPKSRAMRENLRIAKSQKR